MDRGGDVRCRRGTLRAGLGGASPHGGRDAGHHPPHRQGAPQSTTSAAAAATTISRGGGGGSFVFFFVVVVVVFVAAALSNATLRARSLLAFAFFNPRASTLFVAKDAPIGGTTVLSQFINEPTQRGAKYWGAAAAGE